MADPRNQIKRQGLVAAVVQAGRTIALNLLQHLAIHQELFAACRHASLDPACGVIDDRRAGSHGRPQHRRTFPHGLTIRHRRAAGIRGAQWQAVVPGHLSGDLCCSQAFGRGKEHRTRLHVGGRGKAAKRHRAARTCVLQQRNGRQRLGQRKRNRPGRCRWRRNPCSGKWRDKYRLPRPRKAQGRLKHRAVMLQG